MNKSKTFYFKDEDANECYSLDRHISEAEDGQKEITLIEAVPDNGTHGFIWCQFHAECFEHSSCTKKYCQDYESKSGRGVCSNRGKMYLHGEKKTFAIN